MLYKDKVVCSSLRCAVLHFLVLQCYAQHVMLLYTFTQKLRTWQSIHKVAKDEETEEDNITRCYYNTAMYVH